MKETFMRIDNILVLLVLPGKVTCSSDVIGSFSVGLCANHFWSQKEKND